MIHHEPSPEIEDAGTHVLVSGKVSVSRVTRRAGRRRNDTILAFLAAHQALSGVPSGGTDATITISADPSRWRYTAEFVTDGCFAGSDLKKAVLKITACIGWDWGSTFRDNPWEEPVAADNLVPLGAKPVAPPEPAEAAWHVYTLCKSDTPYVLTPYPVLALQRGPVCVIQAFADRPMAKTRKIAAEKLTGAVRLFTLSRLLGPSN